MALHTWLLLFAAAVGLSLTPGPNGLLALSHGALHGHRKTLFTVCGGVLGFVILIALSMLGIGAVLNASVHALEVLKLVGGAYLAWLGIQLWRAPPIRLQTDAAKACIRGGQMFRKGFLTAVSNPKALLFYGAFLPQFLDPSRNLLTQFIVMAASFMAVEFVVEYLLALLAHRIRPLLERAGKTFNRVCGGMFVAIGAALPMT
ncbi:MAG: LysE family translocator [Burkholderiaceae bacterium]|nr:MAG: LysE family translocator [Burkholderiaceae bacterium]